MFTRFNRRLFHTITDTTIRINNKEVAKFKVVFNANNDLNFYIKNTSANQHHNIKMPLHNFIFESINDKNKQLNLEVNQTQYSVDIPLKGHLLKKYSQDESQPNDKVVDDQRSYTFS